MTVEILIAVRYKAVRPLAGNAVAQRKRISQLRKTLARDQVGDTRGRSDDLQPAQTGAIRAVSRRYVHPQVANGIRHDAGKNGAVRSVGIAVNILRAIVAGTHHRVAAGVQIVGAWYPIRKAAR